jgi:hypothetical protein
MQLAIWNWWLMVSADLKYRWGGAGRSVTGTGLESFL